VGNAVEADAAVEEADQAVGVAAREVRLVQDDQDAEVLVLGDVREQ
jgi:hypothetical protein